MDKSKYLNKSLRSKGYKDLEDYIDRRGNEIFFDEVWLWRIKAGIEDDFPGLSFDEVLGVLKQIIFNIVSKGGYG